MAEAQPDSSRQYNSTLNAEDLSEPHDTSGFEFKCEGLPSNGFDDVESRFGQMDMVGNGVDSSGFTSQSTIVQNPMVLAEIKQSAQLEEMDAVLDYIQTPDNPVERKKLLLRYYHMFNLDELRADIALGIIEELSGKSEEYMCSASDVICGVSEETSPYIEDCLDNAWAYLSHQCAVCYLYFPDSLMASLVCHVEDDAQFCKSCAVEYFERNIKDKSDIRCLECPVCQAPDLKNALEAHLYFVNLTQVTFRNIELPEDIVVKYEERVQLSNLTEDSRFVCCAGWNCQFPFYVEATTKRATCPSCNLAQCLGCSQEWNSDHENMSCEDYTNLLNDKAAFGTLVAVVIQSVSQEDADMTLSQENACLKYIESDDVPREQKLLLLKFYPFTFTSSTFELEVMRAELVLGILDDLSSKNDYECKISDVIIAVSSLTSPQLANCWENAWKYLSHRCECCYMKHPASKMASFLCHDDGDNGYCKECAKEYFLSSLQNKTEIGCIKCPICEAPDLKQPSAVFEYFVNLHQQTFTNIGMCEQDKARFDIRMREMNLHEDSSVHQCVRCQTHYYGHGELTRITCTVCQTEQCYICAVKWEEEHKGKTCEQYQKHLADAKEATATNEYIAEMDKLFCPQPNCNRMVNFIRGGCQHVKCLNSKCEFEFCAGCGEEHSRDRYRHARNCFCRMRELDLDRLMNFLVKNGRCVDPNGDTFAGCTVPVENENGEEEICQKPVFKVAYCRAHYKSWLIKKINDEQLETAKLVFSEDNLHPLAQYLDAKGFKYATANVGAGEVEVPTARDIKDYNAMIDICINEIPLSNLSGRPLFHLVEHEETAL